MLSIESCVIYPKSIFDNNCTRVNENNCTGFNKIIVLESMVMYIKAFLFTVHC